MSISKNANSEYRFIEENGVWKNIVGESRWTLTYNSTDSVWELEHGNSRKLYRVYGLGASVAAHLRGRLQESTNRRWQDAGEFGVTYSYATSGKLIGITTPSGQGQFIQIKHHQTLPSIERITLWSGDPGPDPDNNPQADKLKEVEYTYYDDVNASSKGHLGSSGDLVEVRQSLRMASGAFQDRYTQYRYESASSRIKAVYTKKSVQRIIDYSSSDSFIAPLDILKADDNAVVGGSTVAVKHFAAHAFTYYTNNLSTDNSGTLKCTTPWKPSAGENLEATYGFTNKNETGLVKSETVGDGCASCSGFKQTTYHYHYLRKYQGTKPDDNEATKLVIEDVEDWEGNSSTRRLYAMNSTGQLLRSVTQIDPINSTKYWCRSWKRADATEVSATPMMSGKTREKRTVEAHAIVDTANELRQFLNPYDDSSGTPWANDEATVAADAGAIYEYRYNADCRHTSTHVKRGRNGPAYYLSAREYGDGTANKPKSRIAATYSFRTKTTNLVQGVRTDYEYTFWVNGVSGVNDLRAKTLKTIYPATPVVQHGPSDTFRPHETTYYDQAGRVRWRVNPEGYISYFAQYNDTGKAGLAVYDCDPANPTAEMQNPDGWVALSDFGADSNKPTRHGSLNSPLAMKRTWTHDALGRVTSSTDNAALQAWAVYEPNRTLSFDLWDPATATSAVPVGVSVRNESGRVVEWFTVTTDRIAHNGVRPTGLKPSTDQSHYVGWVRYHYDGESGLLKHVDRYHQIPDLGEGLLGTNYYRTSYAYDAMGRRGATVKYVAADKYQVLLTVRDALNRHVASKRGVGTTAQAFLDYDALSSAAWLATTNERFYDGGDAAEPLKVGNGWRTSKRSYQTIAGDHSRLDTYRNFRGIVRGSVQIDVPASGPEEWVATWAYDQDWLGLATASANYTETSTPAWATLTSGDGDANYVSNNISGRRYLSTKYRDNLGRTYRSEHYPFAEATKHFERIYYRDRIGRLIASGSTHGVFREMAYDGLGRRYQNRVVKIAGSYSGDRYQYAAPSPHPNFATMSGSNGGVITLSHTNYSNLGRVTASFAVDLNHYSSHVGGPTNENGFGLANGVPSTAVRSTTHYFHDAFGRVTALADYGAGGASDGETTWKASALPAYSAVGDTSILSSDANRLINRIVYDTLTGRVDKALDTSGRASKSFVDDFGRTLYSVDNYIDFDVANGLLTGLGGGANSDEDRVTEYAYDGPLGHSAIVFYNGGVSRSQTTKYWRNNQYNASLITHIAYPDSSSTPSQATDLIASSHRLDGRVTTTTDQRGVTISYAYDKASRETIQSAAVPSGVDDHAQSIGRSYDDFGQIVTITSYAGPDATGTVRNQVAYTRHATWGLITHQKQNHTGLVTDQGTQTVSYVYDESIDSNDVFSDGLRVTRINYPAAASCNNEIYYGSSGNLNDRLNRPIYRKLHDGTLRNGSHAHTIRHYYTGTGRLARLWSESGAFGFNAALDYYGGSGNYTGWDRFGRVIKHQWKRGSTTVDRLEYAYDTAGNRTERDVWATSGDIRDQLYKYDGLNRLVSYEQGTLSNGTITGSNVQRFWQLDQLGNWEKLHDGLSPLGPLLDDRIHNDANELQTSTAMANPVHDAAGNMTSLPRPNAPTQSFSATYDAWNRLVSLNSGATASYEYDGLNRRIKRTEGSYITHFYYNHKWQVLTEANGTGAATATYMYHSHYVDAVAVRMTSTAHANGEGEHFYLSDALYNVTGVMDESSGFPVTERYAYDPYGKPTMLDAGWAITGSGSSSASNEYLYTGRRIDPASGLQVNRNRYYSHLSGRWVGRDPLRYTGGNNMYEYVDGMPSVGLDPQGLKRLTPAQGITIARDLAPVANTHAFSSRAKFWATAFGVTVGVVTSAYTKQALKDNNGRQNCASKHPTYRLCAHMDTSTEGNAFKWYKMQHGEKNVKKGRGCPLDNDDNCINSTHTNVRFTKGGGYAGSIVGCDCCKSTTKKGPILKRGFNIVPSNK